MLPYVGHFLGFLGVVRVVPSAPFCRIFLRFLGIVRVVPSAPLCKTFLRISGNRQGSGNCQGSS